MIKKISVLVLLLAVQFSFAANTIDIQIHSKSMHRDIKTLVIVPDQASEGENFPVVYLLHGYGCDYRTWIGLKPELPELADRYGMIFVCPDGANSWYWDSPSDPHSQYETFISSELVKYIDHHYPTLQSREFRAITGSSMGGHGAFWNAIRHQEVFGAVGAIHGGVDLYIHPNKWDIDKQLGDYYKNQQSWMEHTVMSQLEKLHDGDLAISFECGFQDEFFLECNKALHAILEARGIAHDFALRPGHHDKDYCNKAIDYQLIFFDKFFKSHK